MKSFSRCSDCLKSSTAALGSLEEKNKESCVLLCKGQALSLHLVHIRQKRRSTVQKRELEREKSHEELGQPLSDKGLAHCNKLNRKDHST